MADFNQGANTNYSTPHTTLGTGIGKEKAAGMGKVTRIGCKHKGKRKRVACKGCKKKRSY